MKEPRAGRAWSAPLAEFVDRALDPVLAKQGFAQSDALLYWDEIVGARLAEASRPLRMVWPARGAKRDPLAPVEPATLVVLVEGAFALELQHLAPLILERVNGRLGWRCVGRLQLKQGPVAKRGASAAALRAPSEDDRARAAQASAAVADDDLRDALTRLGAAVLARANDDKEGGP